MPSEKENILEINQYVKSEFDQYVIVFLNIKVSRTIQWNISPYLAIKIIQTKTMNN